MNELISMKELKSKLIVDRNSRLSIKYPNPFEQLDTNGLEWLHLVTSELDIYRRESKLCCDLCKMNLNTIHLPQCIRLLKLRKEIKSAADMDTRSVIKDSSLLNRLLNPIRKKVKSKKANKINLMIISAGR